MEYMVSTDDGADDEMKVVATNTNNDPEEDSRTATFSSKGSKRPSPEPEAAKNSDSKRQKLKGAMNMDHDWKEPQGRTSPEQTLASTRTRRTSKPKQQKMGNETSKQPAGWQELTKKTLQEVGSSNSISAPAPRTRSQRLLNASSILSSSSSLTSIDGVKSLPAASDEESDKGRGFPVWITRLPHKVTLEELQEFLGDFDHDPLPSLATIKKKGKKVKPLRVTFQSLAEAQRAITELNKGKVRSKKVFVRYDSGNPPKALAAPAAKPNQKSQAPQLPTTIDLLSDEEGEIDESAPPQALAVSEAEEDVRQAELLNAAARQMVTRLCKRKFKVAQTKKNFDDGTALLLSVKWPTVTVGSKGATREMLRRRLYGIIPFTRYDTISGCLQPTLPRAKAPETCIVVYTSQEATTAAEQYLNSKHSTEQDLKLTIDVERSVDTNAQHKPVSKGVGRECLAFGIASIAREEIAQGLYTTKRFLSYCSSPHRPLFEKEAGVNKPPSERKSIPLNPLSSYSTNIFPFPESGCFLAQSFY